MRNAAVVGLGFVLALAGGGCAKAPDAKAPSMPTASSVAGAADTGNDPARSVESTAAAVASDGPSNARDERPRGNGWIGAAAESDLLLAGTSETFLGVWIDVPEARPSTRRPPMEVALVIDTSGSMAGAKIENARAAASTLVRSLKDGDIVALDTFSDAAHTLIPPTVLNNESRRRILHEIVDLTPHGSTNMFDGLTLGEGQLAAAPATHALRRVVVISDGIANVGPSTPEALGAIAERGLHARAQVTSLGVGTDYDERTLNALAVKSSGRLYHLTEPREMASILKGELDLLDATVASGAFVEIVPAPGVKLAAVDGIRSDWAENGALRIPLGALHAGQHREALVRVRLAEPATLDGQPRTLASVRLRFNDAQDGGLERVQETVARAQVTNDAGAVTRAASSRVKAILALQDAAKLQMAAAQRINQGQFGDADKELARAEASLSAQQAVVTAPMEKKRLADAQGKIAAARKATQTMPSAPAAAQRAGALEMNASGMKGMGF